MVLQNQTKDEFVNEFFRAMYDNYRDVDKLGKTFLNGLDKMATNEGSKFYLSEHSDVYYGLIAFAVKLFLKRNPKFDIDEKSFIDSIILRDLNIHYRRRFDFPIESFLEEAQSILIHKSERCHYPNGWIRE